MPALSPAYDFAFLEVILQSKFSSDMLVRRESSSVVGSDFRRRVAWSRHYSDRRIPEILGAFDRRLPRDSGAYPNLFFD
jgi:hypothetical protein